MLTDNENRSDQDMLAPFTAGIVPEQDVLQFMTSAIRPGDHVVDGGANIGFYTIVMSKLVGEQGHVTAFEPDPSNVEKLTTNLQLNNCNNVMIIDKPLWAERIRKNFNLCEHNSWGTLLDEPYGPAPIERLAVVTTTLDEVPGPLRYIKLDIEGSELPALCGAARHIAHSYNKDHSHYQCPFISCELNKVMLQQMQIDQHVLNNMMRAHGYEAFLLRVDTPPVHIPKGARATTTDNNESAVLNLLFSTTNPPDV